MKPVTALRPETFKNLQLNAGAFLVDFDFESYKTMAELEEALNEALKDGTKTLGATRGGGTFTATPEVRNIEADGKRYEFKGSTIFDSWDIKLTSTLLEINSMNMKRTLASADEETVSEFTGGTKKKIKIRTALKDEDYISKLCWFGNTSEGLVAIELMNALNTTGVTLTFTDKGEGTLPVEFKAHQENLDETEYAPCGIYFFDQAAA